MATNGGIALKGDRGKIVKEYENLFCLSELIVENTFDDYEKFIDDLFENSLQKGHQGIISRGIQKSGEWVIIIDPTILDWLEKEKLERLSESFDTDIFTFTIQTTSNCFAFSMYSKSLTREFISIDGEIQSDFGKPLVEENGLTINEQVFTDDILDLAVNLGINLIPIKTENDFVIKEWLDHNFQQSTQDSRVNTDNKERKPWWKIW